MSASARTAVFAVGMVLALGALGAEPAPVRMAVPGLRAAGLDAAIATQVTEAFARELEAEGLEVTTAQEIAEKVGRERQQQLLGCEQDASNCLAEIASALNADAVLTGSVAKIGSRYLANLKVLSPGGAILSVLSRSAEGPGALESALAGGAGLLAADVFKALGKTQPSSARSLQLSRPRLNHVSLWLFLLLARAYGVEYERALLPHLSVTAAAVWVNSVPAGGPDDVGAELVLGARWFPFGQAPGGLWTAAELQLGFGQRTPSPPGEFDEPEPTTSGALIAPGLGAGYTFTPGYGVTVTLGLSIYRHLGPFQFSNSLDAPVQVLARTNLGYAF